MWPNNRNTLTSFFVAFAVEVFLAAGLAATVFFFAGALAAASFSFGSLAFAAVFLGAAGWLLCWSSVRYRDGYEVEVAALTSFKTFVFTLGASLTLPEGPLGRENMPCSAPLAIARLSWEVWRPVMSIL